MLNGNYGKGHLKCGDAWGVAETWIFRAPDVTIWIADGRINKEDSDGLTVTWKTDPKLTTFSQAFEDMEIKLKQ